MIRFGRIFAGAMLAVALTASACGGDGDGDEGTSTPSGKTAVATGTRSASTSATGTTATEGTTPAAGTTAAPAAGATTAPAAPPAAGSTAAAPPAPEGRVYTAAEAQAAMNTVPLTPSDLPGGWTLTTDNTTDNAAAKAADPEAAAGVDRCGRLLGRLTVNQPPDLVAAFLAGETLSYFSTTTFYATEAGAIDCSNEAGARFLQPGELARAFGSIFINPDAVNVASATYEPVGDGSFAATLTGQISAAGNVIDLTIFIVAFRSGNQSAVVGSARSGSTPPSSELKQYVDLVLQRIEENQ